ncbi:MAG: DUF3224 domain-containing protein [Sphaerobacter sp.]|nr:DUF3224 domain-containing protein [Sphaerobacter sp.]
MRLHATGHVEGTSWEEQVFSQIEGRPKLARASVTNVFHGDIEGTGTLEYLMVYHDDESATFVGLEHVVGRIVDRTGSFVLEHRDGHLVRRARLRHRRAGRAAGRGRSRRPAWIGGAVPARHHPGVTPEPAETGARQPPRSDR